MTRRIWTDEEIATLVKMHAAGESTAAIARALRVSSPTIHSKLDVLNIARNKRNYNKRRPWTDSDTEKLQQWFYDGETCRTIAARLQRTTSSIENKLAALGHYGNGEDYSEPDPCGALDDTPCSSGPGSQAKVETMRNRLERGVELWHPNDKTICGVPVDSFFAGEVGHVPDYAFSIDRRDVLDKWSSRLDVDEL